MSDPHRSHLVATTRSLRDIFSKRIFHVPDYQRGYSWDSANVQDFLSDLDYLRVDKNHYTGTLVLHDDSEGKEHRDAEDSPLTRLAVVDGQQRLTTIVILLNSIRLALERATPDDDASDRVRRVAQAIRMNFIETEGMNGQPIHRLALNQGTNDFFHRHVLAREQGTRGPRIPSETRLIRAKGAIDAYIESNVSRRDPKNVREFLLNLYRKVADRLRFSLYEVEQEADVGVIFEVMNDRGKPLSELEKVKNYLLYASATMDLPNDLGSSVNDAWQSILSGLLRARLESSEDENRLLRAHWTVHYDYQPRKWAGVKSVKDRFNVRSRDRDTKQLLNDLVLYTQRLQDTCVPFCDAYEPYETGAFASFNSMASEGSSVRDLVREWSDKLSRLRSLAPFVPLLVATRLRHPNDATSYLEILRLCENYAFRVFGLQESRADAGQSQLFHMAHRLAARGITDGAVKDELRDLIERRCNDEEFERLLTRQVNWYEWRGLRYFLYEYEIALASGRKASPRVTWRDLSRKDKGETTEHILPQERERRDYWTSRFSQEEHRRLVHDIGNLTLTRYNSSLSDKPFPDKKVADGYCYSKSSFFSELDLLEWEEWTPESIEQRRERILGWARRRWASGR